MQKYTFWSQNLKALPFKNWDIAILAINLLTILAAILSRTILPPVVPLFYGQPYGPAQLAPQGSLVIPGVAALTISILCIALSTRTEDDFLKKVLFGCMVGSAALSLVTTIKIIFLVGSVSNAN